MTLAKYGPPVFRRSALLKNRACLGRDPVSAPTIQTITQYASRNQIKLNHNSKQIKFYGGWLDPVYAPRSASLGLTAYSQVDTLGLRHNPVNFGDGKSPGPQNWPARIDSARALHEEAELCLRRIHRVKPPAIKFDWFRVVGNDPVYAPRRPDD